MAPNTKLQRLARERQARTGEKYTVALRAVRAEQTAIIAERERAKYRAAPPEKCRSRLR